MEHNPNAQSKERKNKFGEVFTPEWLVRDMMDALEKESPGAFAPERTFLEPCCGEGVFVLEVLRRKFARCQRRTDFTTALKSVYAMELQADNVAVTIHNVEQLCREYFKLTKEELQMINDHVIQADSLKIMRMMQDEQLKGVPECD